MYIFSNFKRTTILQSLLCFTLLFALHLLLREMRDYFITESHVYDYYRSMFSEERVQEILKNREVDNWSFFVIKPMEIFISTVLILTVFVTGFFLMEKKVRFLKLLNAILLAQAVLYIPLFIQNVWFMMKEDFTIKEYRAFSWHSLYDLFPEDAIPQYLNYALHKINLFQFIFIIILAILLKKNLHSDFLKSLKHLAIIYFPALTLWCSFITFLILYFK